MADERRITGFECDTAPRADYRVHTGEDGVGLLLEDWVVLNTFHTYRVHELQTIVKGVWKWF